MNWNLIVWFGGVLITFGVLKFMLAFFKALTGKEARQRAISAIGEKINDGAEELNYRIQRKMEERRERKIEEKKPIITIR